MSLDWAPADAAARAASSCSRSVVAIIVVVRAAAFAAAAYIDALRPPAECLAASEAIAPRLPSSSSTLVRGPDARDARLSYGPR